jgi:hypothetical protein
MVSDLFFYLPKMGREDALHGRASQGTGHGSRESSWLGACHAGVGAVTTKQRVS